MGVQLLWEDDLARAFYLAAKSDAPGPFNVGTEDWLSAGEFAEIHGQRLRRVPLRSLPRWPRCSSAFVCRPFPPIG